MTEVEKKIRIIKYKRHTQERTQKVKELMRLLAENEKQGKLYRDKEISDIITKSKYNSDNDNIANTHNISKNVFKLFDNPFYNKVYFNNKNYKLKKINDVDEYIINKKEEKKIAQNIIVNILQTSSEEQVKKEMTYLIKSALLIGEMFFQKIIDYFILVLESKNLTNEIHKEKVVYLIDVLYTLEKIPVLEIRRLLKYIKTDERKLEECIRYKALKSNQIRNKYKKNLESISKLMQEDNKNRKIEIVLNDRIYEYVLIQKDLLDHNDKIYILSILKENVDTIGVLEKQTELIREFEIEKYFRYLKRKNYKFIENKKIYYYLINFFKNEYSNIEFKIIIDESNIPTILKKYLWILDVENLVETYNNTIITKTFSTKKIEEAIVSIYSIAEILKNVSIYNKMYVKIDIQLNCFKSRTEIENYIIFNKKYNYIIKEILNFDRSYIQTKSKTYTENISRYLLKENNDEIKIKTREDLNFIYKDIYMEKQAEDIIYNNIIKKEGSIENILTVPLDNIRKDILKLLEDMMIYFKIVEISKDYSSNKTVSDKQNIDIDEEEIASPINEQVQKLIDILFFNETKLKILLYQKNKKESFNNYFKKELYLKWTKNNPEYLKENILKLYEETIKKEEENMNKKYGNSNITKCILPYKITKKSKEQLKKKYIRKIIDLR